VIGLAGLDAHARLSLRTGQEPRRDRTIAARPTYREAFGVVVQGVQLATTLGADPIADAKRLLDALRAGHTFSVITGIAGPASLVFNANQAGNDFVMGDRLPANDAAMTLHAAVPQLAAARIELWHDGARLLTGQGSVTYSTAAREGSYRVEAYYPGALMPWIVSNPISIGTSWSDSRTPVTMVPPVRLVPMPGAAGWTIERDATSAASVSGAGESPIFTYGLGPGVPAGQYGALVASVDPSLGQEGFDRVVFTASADRPMRLSVQLRLPGGRDGQRWRRSIYLDRTQQSFTLSLQDFQPVGGAPTSLRPIVARVRSLLFVADTLNASPGSGGRISLSGVALGVGDPERH
jgi:hypothetical protein